MFCDANGKVPECVEHQVGEVLAARNAAIANAEDVPGVGPPDLFWIQRTAKAIFSKKKPKMQGYYHWVVGLAVTSTASIAAYFARLAAADRKVGYLQGMGVGMGFTIGRGIYCCYDPFSDMDIWVEMALPGGAVARALDRRGYLHDVTAEMWRGAHVGCFLRAQLYDVSVTLHCSRAFQHMTFFKTHEDEAELLSNVVELYRLNVAQTASMRLQWDKGQGTEPHHMDIPCATILEHFRIQRRWQRGLQFFTELQEFFPSSVVYQAEIYRELHNREGAADLIRTALQTLNKQEHPMLVLAGGYVYLERDEALKAAQVAQSVLDRYPQNRPAWLLLSRSLLCQELYSPCMRALHLMPSPLVPSDRSVLLFRVPPPRPRFITRQRPPTNPEVTEVSTVFEESQKIGMLMNVAPGQILAPRTQSHGVDCGLISCMQCVMRAVYDILLDIVENIGWEKFCATRATVFSLPSDDEGTGVEKQEWRPIRVEITYHEKVPLTGKLVSLSFILRDNTPWEKPRRKTASLYARSMSAGTANGRTKEDPAIFETSRSLHLATDVVERGLGQITKKQLRQPSPSSTVLHADSDPGRSGTPEAVSEALSPFCNVNGRCKGETDFDAESEQQLTPSPRAPSQDPVSTGETTPHMRKCVEMVTTIDRLPSEDEIPDAPENALPKQCPPYALAAQRHGPPSSTGVSTERWQVKIVSMGIKDRVKFFDQMAKDKIAKQAPGLNSSTSFDSDTCVTSMRPRRSRYSISQTIMERLIHDGPVPEAPSEATPRSVEVGPGDAEESSNVEIPLITDWGSFALDEASCVPQSSKNRSSVCLSLFDGHSSVPFLFPNDVHQAVYDKKPRECAEWLDELILALWEDLATYTEFKTLDRRLRSKNMQTHAEQILGTIEWNTDTDEEDMIRTPTALLAPPESRPVDWMRRGLLCERLRKLADAEQAYRACVFQSFNLTSLLALSRIYSSVGSLKGSLILLNRLAQFHHKKRKSNRDLYLPLTFVTHMSHLMESVGNKDLKAAAEDCHPLVEHALQEVLRWRLQQSSASFK